jgi:predicted nucleic acid-binding protein
VKLLADTCIWSLFLRRRRATALSADEQIHRKSLADAIQDGQIVMVGPIRQEVLSGIKDLTQFERLRSALAAFPDEPLTTFHYEQAARLFNVCRSRGVECGPTDILICAAAAEMQWGILTCDQGLLGCIRALRAEGLMP